MEQITQPLNGPTTYFQLIQKVNSKGRYQTFIFIIFCLQWFITGILLLGPSFLFMTTDPTCPAGISKQQCDNLACLDPSQYSKYFQHNKVNSLVYSFGHYYVCNDPIITIVKSMTYAGCFFGYVFFSFFADNFGRRYTMLLTWLVTIIGFALISVSWHISVVGIGLFLAGAGADSAINIAFFFFNEVVQYERRQYFSIAVQIAFNLGGMALAGIFKVMPDWRYISIFALLLPSLLAMVLMYYLEQTPRFSIKKGNQQALQMLGKIAKINGFNQNPVTLEDIQGVVQQQVDQQQFQTVITALDIFRYKSLRTKSICCCLISYCIYNLYYGPIMIIDQIGLNIYLNQILLCASQLITYAITFFFVSKIPRKISGFASFAISGAMTLIIIFLKKPDNCNFCSAQIWELVLICIARFCISMYFSIFLIYTNELYPSKARGLGIGISSAIGTVASTTNPYILDAFDANNFDPMILFTAISIIAFIVLIPLGQTLNVPLSDQIEQISKKKSIYKSVKKNSLIKTKTASISQVNQSQSKQSGQNQR